MKEAFEKIIEGLEERSLGGMGCPQWVPLESAIEIVNQVAEEYKVSEKVTGSEDGWVPCSEDAPKIAGWYLAHIEHKRGAFITIEKVLWKKCKYGSYKWYRKGNDCEVIAWRPLPPAYQPKGE